MAGFLAEAGFFSCLFANDPLPAATPTAATPTLARFSKKG